MSRKRKFSSLSPTDASSGSDAGTPDTPSRSNAPAQTDSNTETRATDSGTSAIGTADQASPSQTPPRRSSRIQELAAAAARNTPTSNPATPPQPTTQTTTSHSGSTASTSSISRSVRIDLRHNTRRHFLTCRSCRHLFEADRVEVLDCRHPICFDCAAEVRSGERTYDPRGCAACIEFLESVDSGNQADDENEVVDEVEDQEESEDEVMEEDEVAEQAGDSDEAE